MENGFNLPLGLVGALHDYAQYEAEEFVLRARWSQEESDESDDWYMGKVKNAEESQVKAYAHFMEELTKYVAIRIAKSNELYNIINQTSVTVDNSNVSISLPLVK